jgi:hypothetical protein
MGLDASKNTDEEGFDFQREFFRTLTEDIYSYNETSIRVGVFAYDDTIHLQSKLWSNMKTSEVAAMNAIDSLNYTNGNDVPYVDHALRFVLASFDDDIARNKARECSEKVLMMVITEHGKKWSEGRREVARLREIGIKLVFVHVGDKTIKFEFGKNLSVPTYNELNSQNNVGNASYFLRTIFTEG